MGKHTSPNKGIADTRSEHSTKPSRRNYGGATLADTSVEGWPIGEPTMHALDDPDIGVDSSAFYRWRRNKSEPPPPLGPTGSGLSRYRRREQ